MVKLNYIRRCSIDGCMNRHHARGFCMGHYSKTDFKKSANVAYRKRNPNKVRAWRKTKRLKPLLTNEEKTIKRREATRLWRKNNPERARELNRFAKLARRARRKESKIVKKINKKRITNWYSRMCGICGLFIESEYHIDHIIPISRGGFHIESNLQLAHPYCNRSKFNKLPEEYTYSNIQLQRADRSLASA